MQTTQVTDGNFMAALMSTRRHMCNLSGQGLPLVFNQYVFNAHILLGPHVQHRSM